MSEPWIRVHANLAGKPVIWRAVDALGVSQHEAIGLLVQFWGAVSQHAQNGSVATLPDNQLEAWAGWRGKRGKFAAFIRDKHLDPSGRVNEWDEYAGALEHRREKERTRKQLERERKSRANSTDSPQDVTRTNHGQDADSPQDIRSLVRPTRANETIRDDTLEPSPPPPASGPDKTWTPRLETALSERLVSDPARNALTVVLCKAPNRLAWCHELMAMLDGMAGHIHATAEQLGSALSEFVANGGAEGNPGLAHFKRYVERVVKRSAEPDRTSPARAIPKAEAQGRAALVLADIRKLVKQSQQPGQAAHQFIRADDVRAMGADVFTAYTACGGAKRVIDAEGEQLSYLIRDFTNALEAARANHDTAA